MADLTTIHRPQPFDLSEQSFERRSTPLPVVEKQDLDGIWSATLAACPGFREKRERELAASALLWTAQYLQVLSATRAMEIPCHLPGLEDTLSRIDSPEALSLCLLSRGQCALAFYPEAGTLFARSANGMWHVPCDNLLAAPWRDMAIAIGGFAAQNPARTWSEPSGELVLLASGSYRAKVTFDPSSRRRFLGSSAEWQNVNHELQLQGPNFLAPENWQVEQKSRAA